MTFSSEQVQRARELALERRKYAGIQRLLMEEFKLRPAQCRALLSVSRSRPLIHGHGPEQATTPKPTRHG